VGGKVITKGKVEGRERGGEMESRGSREGYQREKKEAGGRWGEGGGDD